MADWIKVDYCWWCQVTSKPLFKLNIKNPAWHIWLSFKKWYLLTRSYCPLPRVWCQGPSLLIRKLPLGFQPGWLKSSPSLGSPAGSVRHVARVRSSLLETLGSSASLGLGRGGVLKGAEWGQSRPSFLFFQFFSARGHDSLFPSSAEQSHRASSPPRRQGVAPSGSPKLAAEAPGCRAVNN